jgi:hypothetical protein
MSQTNTDIAACYQRLASAIADKSQSLLTYLYLVQISPLPFTHAEHV